jgi:hypothetical protein
MGLHYVSPYFFISNYFNDYILWQKHLIPLKKVVRKKLTSKNLNHFLPENLNNTTIKRSVTVTDLFCPLYAQKHGFKTEKWS